MFTANFNNTTQWVAFAPLLSSIKNSLGINSAEVGVLWASMPGAFVVTTILAGVVYDRFGPKWPLRIGIAVLGIAAFARGFATDVASILIVHVVIGASVFVKRNWLQ